MLEAPLAAFAGNPCPEQQSGTHPSRQAVALSQHLSQIACQRAKQGGLKQLALEAKQHCETIEEFQAHPNEMRNFEKEGFVLDSATKAIVSPAMSHQFSASCRLTYDDLKPNQARPSLLQQSFNDAIGTIFPVGRLVQMMASSTSPLDCAHGFLKQLKNDKGGIKLLGHVVAKGVHEDEQVFVKSGFLAGVGHVFHQVGDSLGPLLSGVAQYVTEDFRDTGCYTDRIRREKVCQFFEKVTLTALLWWAGGVAIRGVTAGGQALARTMVTGAKVSSSQVRTFVQMAMQAGGNSARSMDVALRGLGPAGVKTAEVLSKAGQATARAAVKSAQIARAGGQAVVKGTSAASEKVQALKAGAKNLGSKVSSQMSKTTPGRVALKAGKLVVIGGKGAVESQKKVTRLGTTTVPFSSAQQQATVAQKQEVQADITWCNYIFQDADAQAQNLKDSDFCNPNLLKDPGFCAKNPDSCTDYQKSNQEICHAFADPKYKETLLGALNTAKKKGKVTFQQCPDLFK